MSIIQANLALRFTRSLDLLRLALLGRLTNDITEVKRRIKDSRDILEFVTRCKTELRLPNVKNPRISIVIPTRNEAKYLPLLLCSLLLQTYRSFEVIVVDYRSSDGTPEIARLFGAHVIDVDKPGIGYADHVGVLHSRGEIIIKTDADTIFPPHLLEVTNRNFENNNVILYHVSHIYYDGGFLENLLAYLYDKQWRKIYNTTGHFIAFKKGIYGRVIFNPKAKVGEDDYSFGYGVYKKFGEKLMKFDLNTYVLVSARRIRKVGLLRYLLKGGY